MADAMYAPVVTRFLTYDVKLDAAVRGLLRAHHGHARDEEWIDAAKREPDDIDELDMEF